MATFAPCFPLSVGEEAICPAPANEAFGDRAKWKYAEDGGDGSSAPSFLGRGTQLREACCLKGKGKLWSPHS